MQRPGIYFLIFALSGFSGLIYESVWTHYLKLFLGHAAYAQTLVLAIFMGGMAAGAALCSRYSARWRNLLGGYALVEGVVGLCALVYHPLFDAGIDFCYGTVIPALPSPAAVALCKWGFSTLSILPQSVLLGMTFPLMSGAFLRSFPQRSGSSLAMLYFANSIGAVVGVLASGFVLVDLAGFPGTMAVAGGINLFLALAVWLLARQSRATVAPAANAATGDRTPGALASGFARLLLLTALGTGTASFAYEIGWIRLLALVLGSSTHAFELMLSAFLLGLAGGGLWIKTRIDRLDNPRRFLAVIQLLMGMAALATLPAYNLTFPLMQWLVRTLPKTEAGYLLFNLGSYGIAAAIMLPATFCAGMTLPLITDILFRRGYGEKSIGAVYAANTVGAIVGIFGAVHLVMPALGLKGLLATGATLDMLLAVLLVATAAETATRRLALPFAGACTVTVALAALLVHPDRYKMASGVYRAGVRLMTPETTDILFHKDGKTATISVAMARNGVTNIITNGKSDSAINLRTGAAAMDESTTTLCGALPFFYLPRTQLVANIGLGTGLTTQTLLTNPRVQRVDTIEIEQAVIDGAACFRSQTQLVYSDRRSNLIVDDAKSVISGSARRYDVIVSEPSNPWVSGVASLFSSEFYRHVNRHLQDDGLFVQWLQLYESDLPAVASVFKALSRNFADYAVYLTGGNADLMVVAKKRGALGPLQPEPFQLPGLRAQLARINVLSLEDLRIRELGRKAFLDPLFGSYPIAPNSDYFPVLDQRVGRAKFLDSGAFALLQLAAGRIPLYPFRQLLHTDPSPADFHRVTVADDCGITLVAKQGVALRDYLLSGHFSADAAADERVVAPIRTTARRLRTLLHDPHALAEPARRELLATTAMAMLPYLPNEQLQPVWHAIANGAWGRAMSTVEQRELELFRALGARNFPRTVALAQELLATDQTLAPPIRHYLIGVGMLASLAGGNRGEAQTLARQYLGSREQEDPVFRLLLAQAGH